MRTKSKAKGKRSWKGWIVTDGYGEIFQQVKPSIGRLAVFYTKELAERSFGNVDVRFRPVTITFGHPRPAKKRSRR